MESLPYHLININKKRDLENHLNNLYDKIKRSTDSLKGKMGQWRWKNTKYFLGLEKKQQTQNVIHELYYDKNICTEYDDIHCALCNFYENLYISQSVLNKNIDLYLDDCNTNKLSNIDKD